MSDMARRRLTLTRRKWLDAWKARKLIVFPSEVDRGRTHIIVTLRASSGDALDNHTAGLILTTAQTKRLRDWLTEQLDAKKERE